MVHADHDSINRRDIERAVSLRWKEVSVLELRFVLTMAMIMRHNDLCYGTISIIALAFIGQRLLAIMVFENGARFKLRAWFKLKRMEHAHVLRL